MRPVKGRSKRPPLGWVAASHSLNAATNVLLAFLLARSLTVRDFGIIAMGLVFLPLAIAWLRGSVFEPAIIHGGLSRESVRRLFVDCVLVGLLAAISLLVTVVLLGGPAILVSVLFVGVVATVIEEGARWVLFGLEQHRAGASLDIGWAVIQVVGLLLLGGTATSAGIAWAAGAVVSAGAGCLAVRRLTRTSDPHGGIPDGSKRRIWQWGLEYVLGAGAIQLAILIAPITGGVHVAAGLRGGMSLIGATSVLLGGAHQTVAGRLRWVEVGPSLRRWGARLGIGLGLLVACGSIPFLIISDSLGRMLLGQTWEATRLVLPALIVQRVATAIACGPAFVLRKHAGHTVGLWWRMVITVLTLLGVLIGAALGSATGAAWALAVSATLSVPVWFHMLASKNPRLPNNVKR